MENKPISKPREFTNSLSTKKKRGAIWADMWSVAGGDGVTADASMQKKIKVSPTCTSW